MSLKKSLKRITEELKIICPFCNADYTAEMLDNLSAEAGFDTFGADGSAEVVGKIEIKCSNCKKIVYLKEFSSY